MNTVLITGSNGLIGSAAVSFFADKADLILGLDNNMRKHFFGEDGDTKWNERNLKNRFKIRIRFLHVKSDRTRFSDIKKHKN